MKNNIEKGGSRYNEREEAAARLQRVEAGVAQSLDSQGQSEQNSTRRHRDTRAKLTIVTVVTALVGVLVTGTIINKARSAASDRQSERLETRLEHRATALQEEVDQLQGSRHYLKSEVVRLNAELRSEKNLRKMVESQLSETDAKKLQHLETMLIFKGILFNEPSFFNQARKANRLRPAGYYGEPHLFDFKYWMEPYQIRTVRLCLREQKIKCLEWIMGEDDWDKHIDEALRGEVEMAVSGKIHTDKEALDISQSKLNCALAFIHDDPYYWDKVNVNHLNEKWEKEFADWIEKAPRMKEHLAENFLTSGFGWRD